MSETIRSFISFDLDDESVLRELSEAQDRLVDTGANLKLVKLENIHATVRFLGNIRHDMVDAIHKSMEEVDFTPFDVELNGLGVFPNMRYIRVVWAGIQKGAHEIREVFDQLEPRLRKLGFKPDSKGFSPHLTIARVKSGRNKEELVRCVKEQADREFGVFQGECLRLKKSVLTPKGPNYSTLREVCR
ncbi:RNA 2',3'-cyclic phosphodiesterase [Candidatus Bathyarchaeota archaeon]|nr:RNA 2',3'-cyclic phosphodiesterase [Candidatus Bathyarchaeota archaeon]NIR17546.1 RNA 2',3'-cyclic phosphodiesterase [Desulfobacterales bacterium]NIU81234.1 RNA 2',3'-cyclic phosphodiesterase [Candidatus Bathyarchaeota archaeon]NIV67884.1 RNA 2',3'-cyclic phosphodiesterase [Candidatus Bathyarchaeota archaeon]NIW16328.1 RNA 2',3'-cyclic phosphodiesterase [Candidatus Bathyarchaeota archaeon]